MIENQYQTRMDVYSLIMAWGLNLESSCDPVKRVLKVIILEEFLKKHGDAPGVGCIEHRF